jgi:prepilin-type N-terminal cleavage/methylation domain-containing protein
MSSPLPLFTKPTRKQTPLRGAFTLVEIMISITILSIVLAAIYSSWTAILRASKTGLEAAASVQRSRMIVRILEDSLSSSQSFSVHQQFHPEYYSFLAENGNEAQLSFVARLAPSFPRSGKFGDLDMRRLTFSVESGKDGNRELVLRQNPILMELDIDEKEHPLLLAKNVKEFSMQFWDQRQNDWVDQWKLTNQLPKLIMFSVKLADNAHSKTAQEEISRIVNLPVTTVAPLWQVPRLPPGMPGQPGGIPGQPGGLPGQSGQPYPGQPGFVPGQQQMPGQPGGFPGRGVTPQ